MNKITFGVVLTFISIAKGEPPNNEYGTPLGAPLSSYGTPNYHANDHEQAHSHNNEEPKSYEFGYQVKDDYTGTNYNRKESSDGNQVRGEYRVALPDGRTQIVTYWADWQSGFHADVRYEGEAHYPEQYNKGANNGGYNNGGYNNGGYNNGGYNNGGYSNGGYSSGGTQEYSHQSYNGAAVNSLAVNNLASGQDGYNYNNNANSYNDFNSKTRPSSEYGAV